MPMKEFTLHGVTFDSDIDFFIKSSGDPLSPYRSEDIAAVKRWQEAFDTIEGLDASELKYLNERLETNNVLEDLRYYLAGAGLWTGNHPTIKEEIRRRKEFEAEGEKLKAEEQKRRDELQLITDKAIKENDYRHAYHPRFKELNDARENAINMISSKAFIEDFGTEDRVGGIQLFFDRPLWLTTAWETIHDYYMNCGGSYPHPEADFATVMYQVVSNVNGSNAYLMAKNTAKTSHRPTHWTYETDFGKARVVSAGRTLRYNAQCDEVIPKSVLRQRVIRERRNLIRNFREGKIKEIAIWPSANNLNPKQPSGYLEAYNPKIGAVGSHKLSDPTKLKDDPNKELIETIVGYSQEHHKGQLHVERWKRTLEALDPSYDYPYPVMTIAEAKMYVDRGWKRWEPVYEALVALNK